MKFVIYVLIFFSLNKSFALEIDEKLTIRFLKVSNSKKTVLVNRGSEDGLVAGDHAKFFVTSGVVARGVVEKVSPSRSVWSLYRVVDAAEITDDKVLNLKIASPVKITEDPTKSMKDEPIPGGTEKMGLSEDSKSIPNEADQKELDDMGLEDKAPSKKIETSKKNKTEKGVGSIEETILPNSRLLTKNWEAWGTLYLNSLSGTVTSSDTTSIGSTASNASTIDFSAGIERYFFNTDTFLKDFSFSLFLHKRTIESGQDIKLSSNWFEIGGSASYHFLNSPASTNKLIGFGTLALGSGTAKVVETVIINSISTETPINGSSTFLSAGMGAKYILNNGFGVRALLDYYRSSESYSFPNDITVKSSISGPRIQFGVSYRF